MAYLEFVYERAVTHIGFLDTPDSRKPGFDGPGLSVSTEPESWRALKGLNGPEFVLSFSAAQWVDAMTFSDHDLAAIRGWGVQQRYLRGCSAWHALVPEGDDMIPRAYPDRRRAAEAVGRSLDEEIAAYGSGHGACWEEETWRISPLGLKRLERWPDAYLNWEQAIILLYVREVVIPKRPYVVGVWWSEPNRPDLGCAPSGVLFPERLHHFDVEDDEGEVAPFAERFPDFTCPKDPLVIYE